MVQILLVLEVLFKQDSEVEDLLEVLFKQDSEVEDLFCGASSGILLRRI